MQTHLSPARKKRIADARKRQERTWQARNGPVVAYKVGEPHPLKQPEAADTG